MTTAKWNGSVRSSGCGRGQYGEFSVRLVEMIDLEKNLPLLIEKQKLLRHEGSLVALAPAEAKQPFLKP